MIECIFRCDGSESIGLGHISRCCVLAKELESKGVIIVGFWISELSDGRALQLLDGRFAIIKDIISINRLFSASENLTRMLILDHYGCDNNWLNQWEGEFDFVCVIDELERFWSVDLVVDSTPTTSPLVTENHLIGSRYALLNPLLRNYKYWESNSRKEIELAEKKILIYLGSEQIGATRIVAESLALWNQSVDWLVSNSQLELLLNDETFVDVSKKRGDKYITFVDDMPTFLMNYDLVVGAVGVSALERACMGVPSILLCVADNQKRSYEGFVTSGAAEFIPIRSREIYNEIKKNMSNRNVVYKNSVLARKLVDGYGVERVSSLVLSKILRICFDKLYPSGVKKRDLSLMPVEIYDVDVLLILQQIPGVREWSHNPEIPTLDEHLSWFETVIKSNNIRLWMIGVVGCKVGFLRLDYSENAEKISILVAPECQGKGIARWVIDQAKLACQAACLEAEVHPDNTASQALFKGAGFEKVSDENKYIFLV